MGLQILADPRYYLLIVLTLINVCAFWHRNLVLNLSGVKLEACSSECSSGVPFVPLCLECPSIQGQAAFEACGQCQACRLGLDSERVMIQDGACFDNRQFGILAGFGFAITFSLFGLFAGRLADVVGDRRRLLASACLLWSGATAAMSVCTTFEGLLLARVVAGVAQAFNAPCAYPVILGLFSRETRSTANGVYAVGTYVGAAVSSLSLGLASRAGWRAACAVAGAAGAAAALLLHRTTASPEASGLSTATACRLAGPTAWLGGGGGGGSAGGWADDESAGLLASGAAYEPRGGETTAQQPSFGTATSADEPNPFVDGDDGYIGDDYGDHLGGGFGGGGPSGGGRGGGTGLDGDGGDAVLSAAVVHVASPHPGGSGGGSSGGARRRRSGLREAVRPLFVVAAAAPPPEPHAPLLVSVRVPSPARCAVVRERGWRFLRPCSLSLPPQPSCSCALGVQVGAMASSPEALLLVAATSCRMAATFTAAAYFPTCAIAAPPPPTHKPSFPLSAAPTP